MNDVVFSNRVYHVQPKQFIDETLKDNCVVVFAKSECQYSRMAKDVFDQMNVPYKAVDIDLRDDGTQIQKILGERTKEITVRIDSST